MKLDVQFETSRWMAANGAIARQLNVTVEEILPYAVASVVKWAMNNEPAPTRNKQRGTAVKRARKAAQVTSKQVAAMPKGVVITHTGKVQLQVDHRNGKRYNPLYAASGFQPIGDISRISASGDPYEMVWSQSTKQFVMDAIKRYESELDTSMTEEEKAQFFPRLAWAQILMDLHNIGAINVDNVRPKSWKGGKARILRAVARDGRQYKNASGRKFGSMGNNNLAIEIEQAFPNVVRRRMEDRFIRGFKVQTREIEKQFRDDIFRDQQKVAAKYPGLVVTR
jgi:hypothetical protein